MCRGSPASTAPYSTSSAKNLRAQINVENIFGVKYYPSADSNNNITIGSPRAARHDRHR